MKKGQLAFFAFQLASLVLFLIVLFSILFMKRNLWFTLKEFDTQTLYSVGERTLLSSSSCLAYEEVYNYYDSFTGKYITLHRVYPGIIDFDKYLDVTNFNCMRKDFSAEKGGASYRYCILILDPSNKSWANYTRVTTDGKIEAPLYKCSLVLDKENWKYTPKAVYLSEENKHLICPSPYRTYGITMGYVNGSLRPVFIVIEQCILSNKYEGKDFCEVSVQVRK